MKNKKNTLKSKEIVTIEFDCPNGRIGAITIDNNQYQLLSAMYLLSNTKVNIRTHYIEKIYYSYIKR